ncbi:uncharacterized protein Dwil_GK17858 [Drosophila willistoni]|uniref:Uncharacterized protein n=1 Tax=Drosophila willistoni TaxID=7260 RepID=B4N5U8_DROWI|nr:uncharacterized protein LOC6646066 [Drosophila willistoni]EDW79737.1 uncharacterized protein Dwil_GK17858 [Drosophila willistoni]
MSDLPENLQIKLESPNIKERLNLHVKRRLQHDPDNATPPIVPETKRAKSKEKEKEPKPRKPYQKRVDKIKTEAVVTSTTSTTGKGKKAAQIASPAAELEPMLDEADLELGAGGAGGGSPEAAGRSNTNRDRHKNADILNMVLSVKKRALLQNPEVQKFWTNIMQALGK